MIFIILLFFPDGRIKTQCRQSGKYKVRADSRDAKNVKTHIWQDPEKLIY